MTVCKFYLKGCCRFGRNCRFEHPGEDEYESTSVSNFSFKSALNEVVGGSGSSYNFQQQQHNQAYNSSRISSANLGGFSFAQALENNSFGRQQRDTQMLDGFSFATAIQQVNDNQSNHFLNQLPHQTTFGSFSSAQSPFGFSNFNQQPQHQLGFSPSQSAIGSFHQPYQSSFGHNNTAFGRLDTQQQSTFGSFQQPPVDSKFSVTSQPLQQLSSQQENLDPDFSDSHQLSKEELDAFKSDKFQFRCIPIRPPPKLLC